MFKYFTVFASICLALVVGCTPNSGDQSSSGIDQAYDRVLESGEIRVGYVPYPPGLIKDPNTGELSGVFFDTLEAVGDSLSLKIEWVEEVSWGTMIEGLKTKRYDVIGSPVWANATRGKVANFTQPLFYSGIGVYARADDNRFNSNLSRINSEQVRISAIDGEMASIIAKSDFPAAKLVALPQLSDVSQLLLEVSAGKSDVTFVEPYLAAKYLKSNPGSLQNVSPDKPVRIFPNSFMLDKQEYALKSMLDIAIQEQVNLGYVEQLLEKYTGDRNSFYQTAYPYRSR